MGYNIEFAVDYMSKMIITSVVTQKATDHNQFPEIILKAMENMGQIPETICTDSAFNTVRTLQFIEETGLNVLLNNIRLSKEFNGHKSEDKYHKDNMPYNYEEDYFSCCNNGKLEYQKTSVRWSEKDADYKIEREYYNKEACSRCPDKDKCCSGKYRKVTISGGILALNMEKKMRN